jgi:uncharacterized protein (DUF169 family)
MSLIVGKGLEESFMEDAKELARILRRLLRLKNGPVAVRLIKNHEETPVLPKKPAQPYPSFCLAVMEAFKGRCCYLTRTDILCRMGLVTLGLSKDSSRAVKGGQGGPGGVFASEEAFRNYHSKKICLPPNQIRGVVLTPLERTVVGFDVVLFRINPEQAMWLLNAHQYRTGERIDLSIGTGFQGVCGDVIAYPYLQQKVNLTVNGVGDRLSVSAGKNELFMGIPGSQVEMVASNLLEMYKKPAFQALLSPKGPVKTLPTRTTSRP